MEDLDLIDQVTGVLTPVGPMEAVISDLAFALDGTLYGSSPTGDLYLDRPHHRSQDAFVRPGRSTGNSHSYTYTNTYCNSDSHPNPYAYWDAGTAYSNATAAPNTASAPVTQAESFMGEFARGNSRVPERPTGSTFARWRELDRLLRKIPVRLGPMRKESPNPRVH